MAAQHVEAEEEGHVVVLHHRQRHRQVLAPHPHRRLRPPRPPARADAAREQCLVCAARCARGRRAKARLGLRSGR